MSSDSSASAAIPIALLGVDALVAARPASPLQVLQACVAAGFAAAYPVSWGDELVARECLSRIGEERPHRAILCTCPLALRRIAQDPADATAIAVAAPPVAAARMVRRAYGDQTIRITYVGGCPSGADSELDAHVSPGAFLATLSERGIVLGDQPEAFEGVLPPDRRRFLSIPGGSPAPDRLAEVGYRWSQYQDAHALSSDDATLIDPAEAAGCVCSGAPEGRDAVLELEPPRAAHPIVDPVMDVDLSPGPLIAAILARAVTPAPAPPPDSSAQPPSSAIETTRRGHRGTGSQVPDESVGPIPLGAHGRAVVRQAAATGHLAVEPAPVRRASLRARGRVVVPQSDSIYEDVEPRRRFTLATVLLALSLGMTLPLAAIGGWTLLRVDVLGVIRGGLQSDRVREDSSVSAASMAPPSAHAIDSAGGAMVVDSSSRRADSSEGRPAGVAEAQSTSEHEQAVPSNVSRANTRERETRKPKAPGSDSETSPSNRRPPSGLTGPRAGAPDSNRDVKQASPFELDSLVQEIARRRARLDSLNRAMDSLSRTPKRPPPFH